MLTRRAFTGMLSAGSVALPVGVLRIASAASGTRRAEVEALRAFAETTHPRGCEAAADADWRRRWTELANAADSLSDGAYIVATRRSLGWFRDGHTTVLPFEFTGGIPEPLAEGPFRQRLPVRVRTYADGVRVVAAEDSARGLLGTRVVRIGTMDSSALIREVARDWPGNDAWAQRWSGAILSSPALLAGLGAIADVSAAIPLVVENGAGRLIEQTIPTHAAAERATPKIELPLTGQERWAQEAGASNYVRRLPDHGALFVSIDGMEDLPGKTFAALTDDVSVAMAEPRWSRLVIDLRRNGGGDNYLGEALRKRIERSRFNRPGGLYVLTGPATFSAAQNLATRLERETCALFAGEPTGGSPNHCGDAQPFTGAATGITAIVSSVPWYDSYPQDSRPWILPDLPVPDTYADRAAGKDAVLEAVLAHVPPRGDDPAARDRVLYFSRPSQTRDWQPFWRTVSAT